MRNCSFCHEPCDSSIGFARELRTDYWGGTRRGNVEFSPKVIAFFCSDDHRNDFLATGAAGGEIQTNRWDHNGED